MSESDTKEEREEAVALALAVAEEEEEVQMPDIVVEERTKQYITPAQDFINGRMYYVNHLTTTNGKMPFIVSSDRKLIPLIAEEVAASGLVISPSYFDEKTGKIAPLKDQLRWSIGSAEPYNIHAYLKEGLTVNPYILYQDIRSKFSSYLDYPDERYHTLMAVYSMGTYTYMIFDAYPYILLYGNHRSTWFQFLRREQLKPSVFIPQE